MNKLPDAKKAAVLKALCEGVSIRGTARLTGVNKDTVLKVLVEAGELCSIYQYHKLCKLKSKRIEVDEIWAFMGAKRSNARTPGYGDIWTFTAIDPDSKLMVSWLVGDQTGENAETLLRDVAGRVTGRIQLTTDGHPMYPLAVENAFGYNSVDYSQVVKVFSKGSQGIESRYSPGRFVTQTKETILGRPNMGQASTSYVERSNLSLRMQQRRFTRLTNGFSKKAENHAHAVSLYFMFYNFCRVHATLTKVARGVHTTPAMAAGVTNRVWKLEDVVELMDPKRRIGAAA